jgi:hypothetical protein
MAEEIRIPLPEELVFTGPQAFLLRFCMAILVFSIIRKLFFAKRINLQHSVVSALGILMMYAACIMIYIFDPIGLKRYLVPLPFITMGEEQMNIFSFGQALDSEIFIQLLSMLLLAFLVNQIYHFEPKEVKFLGWLIFRLCSTGIAIAVHIGVCWGLRKLHLEKLPEFVLNYGPIMLIGFILLTFLIGCIKKTLSFFMKKQNPAFEGMNTFYFTNKFGLQISRGLGTTAILTVLVRGLELLDYHQLPINKDALQEYFPLFGLFFLLWTIIGYKL